MLDYLTTVDPRRWQNDNIRLRGPNTGLWFTSGKEFTDWLSVDNSKLWVHGIGTSLRAALYCLS